jgi:hypothetical protein
MNEEDQALANMKDQLHRGHRTDFGVFRDDDDGESEVDPDEVRPDYKTATIARVEKMDSKDGKVRLVIIRLRNMADYCIRSIGPLFWTAKTNPGMLKLPCKL